MQRGKVVAGSDGIEGFLVEDDRLAEAFAAVHDAVTYGIKLLERLQGAVLLAGQCLEDELHTYRMFGDVLVEDDFLAIGEGQLQERAFQTNLLNTALCENLFGSHVKQLVFDGRTTAVQY